MTDAFRTAVALTIIFFVTFFGQTPPPDGRQGAVI